MNDKIEEIRARYAGYSLNSGNAGKANEDRGWLLAEVDRLRAEIERLTRERNEARYFLKIFLHAHASNNAVPPHLEEQSRKALEDKQ